LRAASKSDPSLERGGRHGDRAEYVLVVRNRGGKEGANNTDHRPDQGAPLAMARRKPQHTVDMLPIGK